MGIYGTDFSYSRAALCCTPGVGVVLSFLGECKWGAESSRAEKKAQDVYGLIRRMSPQEPADNPGHGRQQSSASLGAEVAESMEKYQKEEGSRITDIAKKLAIYAITGAVSSVLSLALMVQYVANPIFQISAFLTAGYCVGAYYAAQQVDKVKAVEGTEEQVFPVPVSLAFPMWNLLSGLV